MMIKEVLDNKKKVWLTIWGADDNKFSNGKYSCRRVIFDATPDQVLKVVEQALKNASD